MKLGRMIFSFLAITLFIGSASADAVYTYAGNPLAATGSGASCNACSIQASFTVASPLGPNASNQPIVPLSFSITDGTTTFTDATANLEAASTIPLSGDGLFISTDASGNIDFWYFVENATDGLALATWHAIFPGAGLNTFDASLDNSSGRESTNAIAGIWSEQDLNPVPEPSGLLLLGSALAAVPPFLRRKSCKGGEAEIGG